MNARDINEVFEYKGCYYKVQVGRNCMCCDLKPKCRESKNVRGGCSYATRADRESVVFVKYDEGVASHDRA